MPWQRAVNSSYCLSFDGTNDYVLSSAFTFQSAGTISFWCVSRNPSAGQTFVNNISSFNILSAYVSSLPSYPRSISAGQIGLCLNTTNGTQLLDSNTLLIANLWTHLVMSWNGSSLKLYINGLLDKEIAYTGTFVTPSGALAIGYDSWSSNNFLNGLLDDIRIYHRALSGTEIQSIYRNSSGPPMSGLACYFPFNEGTGITVTDSIGGLTGTLHNGPTWQPQVCPRLRQDRDVVARRKSYSLSFDGTDDYVSVNDVPSLRITGALTLAFWIKTTTSTVGRGIVGKYNATNGQRSYVATTGTSDGSKIEFNYQRVAGSYNPADTLVSAKSVNDGIWHHVACVFSPSTYARIYIDGKQDAEDTTDIQATIASCNAPFEIGRHNEGAYNVVASLRGICLYNSSLSEANIRTLATGGDIAGAVGRWDLNEGTGTTAIDTGSGGNNGTLTNSPKWSTDVPQFLRQDRHTWSASLDGSNDSIVMPVRADLAVNEYTYSAWVKATSVPSNAVLRGIIAIGDVVVGDQVLGLANNYSGMTGFCGISYSTGGVDIVSTGVLPSTDRWYHIALRRSTANKNSFLTVWINGVQSGSVSLGNVTALYGGPTYFNVGNRNNFFAGLIRDVRLYTSALSDANMIKLANNINISGAIRHYKLDEGSGTIAFDLSGECQHGTLTSGPTYTGDIPQQFRRIIESQYSLSLDGTDDHIDCGDIAYPFNGTNTQFTVTLWQYANVIDTVYGNAYMSKYKNSNTTNRTMMFETWGPIAVYVYQDGATNNVFGRKTASVISAGSWNHIAATVNLTTPSVEIYKNGQSLSLTTDNYGTPPTVLGNTSIPLRIGIGDPDGNASNKLPFNGSLDNVCLYDRVLTSAEVQDNLSGYIIPAGLVSMHTFEGSTQDNSGLNHGTPQGGMTYTTVVPGTIKKRNRNTKIVF